MSACGTYTPEIQEFWGTAGDTNTKLLLAVKEAECEIQRAVQLVVRDDIDNVGGEQKRVLAFLDDKRKGWGADVLFQFTVDEKSALTPNFAINPPLPTITSTFANKLTASTQQSRSFSIGGALSSEGYRQDKVHVLFKLSDLVGDEKSLPAEKDLLARQCIGADANGTLFLQSDLKFYDWLKATTDLQFRNQADFALKNGLTKDGAISHDVKFEIVSSGNVSPTWKLVQISANTGTTPLFNTSRDRIQEIIITLGPLNADGQLSGNAKDSAFASSLKAGIDSVTPK